MDFTVTLNQSPQPTAPIHVYELRPRKDHRGIDLISDALPFGRPQIGYADAQQSFT